MSILEEYLNLTENIKCLFVLLDARRNIPEEEIHFIQTAQARNINTILVRTKSDKLNQKEKNNSLKETKSIAGNYIYVSSLTNTGIGELRNLLRLGVQ